MPLLTYTKSQFLPFTKIVSADVNTYFSDIKTLLNVTGLDSTNIQQYGLSRDRLAKTTANAVLINDSSGASSSEAQLARSRGGTGLDLSSLAGLGGQALVVNNAETALTTGSPLQSTITESLSGVVSSLTAGVAINTNDACCLDLAYDASSNNIYRVFKADSSISNRRYNFLGFAQAAATVTAGTYTWVASANFVTSNVITYKINGRSYTTNFTTDNATTLQAVATQMATDPDVNSASSDGSHTVTVTGKGGLFINITSSTVTGGASQPTITVTNTQAPSGQNVKVQCFGPMAGFTSLVTGQNYYLTAAGGITAAPTDTNPIYVGQALSSTVLFINRNVGAFQFSTPTLYIRAGGYSGTSNATGTTTVEQWNQSSWASGNQAMPASRSYMPTGDGGLNGYMYAIDGYDTSATAQLNTYRFDKTSWSTLSNRSTAKVQCALGVFSGAVYVWTGRNQAGTIQSAVDKFDGSSWTNGAFTAPSTVYGIGVFVQGGVLRASGGYDGASFGSAQQTYNGSSTGTSTVQPINATWQAGASSASSNGIVMGNNSNGTASYQWSGSWSSSITVTYGGQGVIGTGSAAGYFSGSAITFLNGGADAGSNALATSAQFNGSAWASATSSSSAREGATGGVF